MRNFFYWNKYSEGKILWVDNLKVLSMFGVLTFHFWLFFNPQPFTKISQFFLSWRDFFSFPFQLGWQGDFLFFCTSGIGLAIMMEKRNLSWFNFCKSRIVKVYIPYLVTITLLLFYQYVSIKTGNWDRPFVLPTTTADWLYNIFLIRKPSLVYFSTHLWFMFILVQLYIIFPFLHKFNKVTNWWGLLVMAAIHVVYRIYGDYIPYAGWLTFIVWINPFYYGIFIGSQLSQNREKMEKLLHKLFPVGVLLWALGTYLTLSPKWYVIANPITSAGLIIMLFKVASLAWSFSFLNKISYEVYLVHLPFTGFYRHFFGFVTSPKIPIYIFYLLSSFILAYIIHWISNFVSELTTGKYRLEIRLVKVQKKQKMMKD